MHQGEFLKKYLEDNKISVKSLAEFLGNSEKTVYSWFTKKSLRDNIIILICSLSDLTYEDFKIENRINPFKSVKQAKGETRIALFPDSEIGDVLFHYDRYFNILKRAISQTNNHIYIYDYLAKMQNGTLQNTNNVVHQKIDDYLKSIHTRINDDNKVYIRILALQLSKNDVTKENSLENIMKYLFFENFTHIWKSYNNQNFTLLIQSKPVKLHSFAVIDDESAISEYESYGFSADALPDILIVNKMNKGKNNYSAKIINRYSTILRKLINEGERNTGRVWKVDAFEFKSEVRKLFLSLSSQIEYSRNEIETIENSILLNLQFNNNIKSKGKNDNVSKMISENKEREKKLNILKTRFLDITKKLNFMEENPIKKI